MKNKIRTLIAKLHLWLGLASGLVIFVVCLTGALYVFRAPIENALNYSKQYIDAEETSPILDSIQTQFATRGQKVNRIVVFPDKDRSLEVYCSSEKASSSGMFYVNPYSGKIVGERNSALSPLFEFVLSAHKSLLMSNVGKQIVGASVLVFVFMLLSGFLLWLPRRLKELGRALWIKRSEGKARFLLDLHYVPGFYSLFVLLVIALMGLYISYPWVKSAFIVSLGGNPVITQASGQQGAKIKKDLATSFSASLAKIIAQKEETVETQFSLDSILQKSKSALPYQGITNIVLPTAENAWIGIVKYNRENFLGAILPDKLEFNKKGKLKRKELFLDKALDKQFVTLSLPLHTGEIMGWPSLILYFVVSLIGASLPVTGTWLWFRRWKQQLNFSRSTDNKNKKHTNSFDDLDSNKCLIVYATKTGNSKLVAQKAQAHFSELNLPINCTSIENISHETLDELKHLFVVISTHGKGVPPPSAQKLFKALGAPDQQQLSDLNYSICALGDSAYPNFCAAGRSLDKLLSQLQAQSIIPRVECDAEFGDNSSRWITDLATALQEANTV